MLSLNEERKMMKKIKRYRHTISLETGIEYSHNPTRVKNLFTQLYSISDPLV